MAGEGPVETWMEEDFRELWESFASTQMEAQERAVTVEPLEAERETREPLPLAVVQMDLPDGLFGFTSRDSSHVVVNRNLYEVDKKRTVRHEKTHHRFPKDELTIRYINGDPEVRNTLSFQANNPARVRGVVRGAPVSVKTAAYGDGTGSAGNYGRGRANDYF